MTKKCEQKWPARRGRLVLGGCTLGLLITGCNTQMVTTSNFYADYATPSLTDGRPTQSTKTPVRPVQGIPYYLPQSVVKVTVGGGPKSKEDETYVMTLTLNGVGQVPDPSQLYLLEIHTEDGTDDDITIGVGANGLLKSAKATSTDRSGDILKKMAETAAAVMNAAGGLPSFTAADCAPLRPFAIDWSLPYDSSIPIQRDAAGQSWAILPTAELEREIYQAMTGAPLAENEPSPIKITTRLDFMKSADPRSEGGIALKPQNGFRKLDHPWPPTSNPENWAPGIRFRLPEIAALSVQIGSSVIGSGDCAQTIATTSINRQRALLMNPRIDYVFDMSRTPLVKTVIDLTVEDGVLTAATVQKNSPALAAATLPLELLNILLEPIRNLLAGPAAAAGTKAGG